MKHRTTPDNITALKPWEVFLFGSNEAGRHGAGAAKTAMGWGAEYGESWGMHGNTYAIPTLDGDLQKLRLGAIEFHVDQLVQFAKDNPRWTFLCTEVGCGLAGFAVEEIGPLFKDAVSVSNIHLPARFWAVLNAEKP